MDLTKCKFGDRLKLRSCMGKYVARNDVGAGCIHLILPDGATELKSLWGGGHEHIEGEAPFDVLEILPPDTEQVWSCEGTCGHGSYKVVVLAGAKEIALADEKFLSETYNHGNAICEELMAAMVRLDPKEQERVKEERKSLYALFTGFPGEVKFEEIPNGYCKSWCCRHRPWFNVTTDICTFTIGWRKRVIHLSWAGVDVSFSGEDTTQGDHMIHCWGYEKAAEYIAKIRDAAIAYAASANAVKQELS